MYKLLAMRREENCRLQRSVWLKVLVRTERSNTVYIGREEKFVVPAFDRVRVLCNGNPSYPRPADLEGVKTEGPAAVPESGMEKIRHRRRSSRNEKDVVRGCGVRYWCAKRGP